MSNSARRLPLLAVVFGLCAAPVVADPLTASLDPAPSSAASSEPGSGSSMPPQPTAQRPVAPADQTRMQAVRDVGREKAPPLSDDGYAGLLGLMLLRSGGPLPYAQR